MMIYGMVVSLFMAFAGCKAMAHDSRQSDSMRSGSTVIPLFATKTPELMRYNRLINELRAEFLPLEIKEVRFAEVRLADRIFAYYEKVVDLRPAIQSGLDPHDLVQTLKEIYFKYDVVQFRARILGLVTQLPFEFTTANGNLRRVPNMGPQGEMSYHFLETHGIKMTQNFEMLLDVLKLLERIPYRDGVLAGKLQTLSSYLRDLRERVNEKTLWAAIHNVLIKHDLVEPDDSFWLYKKLKSNLYDPVNKTFQTDFFTSWSVQDTIYQMAKMGRGTENQPLIRSFLLKMDSLQDYSYFHTLAAIEVGATDIRRIDLFTRLKFDFEYLKVDDYHHRLPEGKLLNRAEEHILAELHRNPLLRNRLESQLESYLLKIQENKLLESDLTYFQAAYTRWFLSANWTAMENKPQNAIISFSQRTCPNVLRDN